MTTVLEFPTIRTERGDWDIESVYLSGRMTGHPEAPEEFRAAAEDLRGRGFNVYSPVEMDIDEGVENLDEVLKTQRYDARYFHYLERDVALLASGQVDAGVFLPGWQESRGARLEYTVLQGLALPTLSYPRLEVLEYCPAGRRQKA